MTPLQLDPSAQAPWTRTMFGEAGIAVTPQGWGRADQPTQRRSRGLVEESCERAADARGVEAVGGAVVGAGAVAAQLDVGDAQRQQAVRAVGKRRGDLGGRRAGEVGLDEHHVAAPHERAQAVGVERPDGRQVGDRRVEIARRRQRLVERRPDRHDDRRRVRAAPQHLQPVGVHRRVVGLLGHPDVDAVVAVEVPRGARARARQGDRGHGWSSPAAPTAARRRRAPGACAPTGPRRRTRRC